MRIGVASFFCEIINFAILITLNRYLVVIIMASFTWQMKRWCLISTKIRKKKKTMLISVGCDHYYYNSMFIPYLYADNNKNVTSEICLFYNSNEMQTFSTSYISIAIAHQLEQNILMKHETFKSTFP